MIVNHSHKFVFIHIPKAAGTSVTNTLAVMTRYCDQEIGGTPFGQQVQKFYAKRFGLRKHSPARDVAAVMGAEDWERYFTFSFVRNPFQRALSTFHFLRQWDNLAPKYAEPLRGFDDFDSFVLSEYWQNLPPGPDLIFRPQFNWIRSAGGAPARQIVDFVGKTETLNADLAHCLRTVGGPEDVAVQMLNQSPRYERPQDWNSQVVDRIIARYRIDFSTFGYSEDPTVSA